MKDKDYDKLITKLESFKDTYSMITYMLTLDYEKKLMGILSTVVAMTDDEKLIAQLRIFVNTVRRDMVVYKEKQERERVYFCIYNSVVEVKDNGNKTYDIAIDHEKIHEFIIDRYDLA